MAKHMQKEINDYWAKRSQSYSDGVAESLTDKNQRIWIDKMVEHFPKEDKALRILDIGTGPGFFAIELARLGHKVTAIDMVEAMLEEAKENESGFDQEIDHSIKFFQMDAESLSFPTESFDIIVTRNLTWNLEEPERAYKEWLRVLKAGGKLINYDAQWYRPGQEIGHYDQSHTHFKDKKYRHYHDYPEAYKMDQISQELPMTFKDRPHWDRHILEDLAYENIHIDTEIYKHLWTEDELAMYADTPQFLIVAAKAASK